MISDMRQATPLAAPILLALNSLGAVAADWTPTAQGHYSQTFENYPKPGNQYPEGDSMGRLSTGNTRKGPMRPWVSGAWSNTTEQVLGEVITVTVPKLSPMIVQISKNAE